MGVDAIVLSRDLEQLFDQHGQERHADIETLDPTIAALKLTNSRAYSPNYRQTCNEDTNLEVQEWNQRKGMGLDVRNFCLQPASKDGVVFYPLKAAVELRWRAPF
jgi:hypothetical protein